MKDVIRSQMDAAGLRQEDLAAMLGISGSTLCNWLNDGHEMPWHRVEALLLILNLEIAVAAEHEPLVRCIDGRIHQPSCRRNPSQSGPAPYAGWLSESTQLCVSASKS